MSKIKFRIEVWEKEVVFQVLEMNERFRSSGSKVNCFKCSNGIAILSMSIPGIELCSVWLQGDSKRYDTRVYTLSFDTPEAAEEYKNKVIEALRDWAENWEGWGEEKKTIYEF